MPILVESLSRPGGMSSIHPSICLSIVDWTVPPESGGGGLTDSDHIHYGTKLIAGVCFYKKDTMFSKQL